jgi:hypothetical protein
LNFKELVMGICKRSLITGVKRGVPARNVHSDLAVIYVFCKFTDAKGDVLPVRHAIFHRVGDYRAEIAVHIKGRFDSKRPQENENTITVPKNPPRVTGEETKSQRVLGDDKNDNGYRDPY